MSSARLAFALLALSACGSSYRADQMIRAHLEKLGVKAYDVSCTGSNGCGTAYCDVRVNGLQTAYQCDWGLGDTEGCRVRMPGDGHHNTAVIPVPVVVPR